eukprot:gnl/MRDRNA2_/MRDRNA2_640312_c0_seq1.p1 gnl/MRDRNA2_/MRDRNA2_640312_c0~~gnl/MRDRNA2_/MRDRNA2_640312_c0_seq1.p1  ORF type:complete len:118 (+),score=21.55 gnl/MRDRNA2_/MRDRNA2_640312_c0_seq1:53-355(+)
MANRRMNKGDQSTWLMWDRDLADSNMIRVSFDSGYREKSGKSGAGWVIEVWDSNDGIWRCIHRGCKWLLAGDSLEAETTALEEALCSLTRILTPWTLEEI